MSFGALLSGGDSCEFNDWVLRCEQLRCPIPLVSVSRPHCSVLAQSLNHRHKRFLLQLS